MKTEKAVYGLKVQYRDFKCTACGHIQSIQTNHTGSCYDYCTKCSWMPSAYPGVQMFGHTYRLFSYAVNIIASLAILADTQLSPRVPALYELQDTMGEYSMQAADPVQDIEDSIDNQEAYMQTEPKNIDD